MHELLRDLLFLVHVQEMMTLALPPRFEEVHVGISIISLIRYNSGLGLRTLFHPGTKAEASEMEN
eukprot:scaffold43959_cov66-Cyclotella_meneghiniana.AAC.2